jgi:hypothetical protein
VLHLSLIYRERRHFAVRVSDDFNISRQSGIIYAGGNHIAVDADCPENILAQTAKDHHTDSASSPSGNNSVQQYPFVNLPSDCLCNVYYCSLILLPLLIKFGQPFGLLSSVVSRCIRAYIFQLRTQNSVT